MRLDFDSDKYTSRWLVYVDLLGFTELINKSRVPRIFAQYAHAIEQCKKERTTNTAIEAVWFSDTFILYTAQNDALSFIDIELRTRWFMYNLLLADIPFRGAMSCDYLYADKVNNLLFGKALIDAYKYGENQDWIGLVICPSARQQIDNIDSRLLRSNWKDWKIPYKKNSADFPENLAASIIGNWGVRINGRNVCIDKLQAMKARQVSYAIADKYENTLQFLYSVENKRNNNQTRVPN